MFISDSADEVQTIADNNDVEEIEESDNTHNLLGENNEDSISLNITVNDTPYDQDVNVEISVNDADSSINYNNTKVNFIVDGSSIGNTTLDKTGKGSFIIPAGKYEAGSYYIMATIGDSDKPVIGKLFNIVKTNPIVNVEDVTAKAGEIVTVPFNVTDSRGKGISGEVIITIYWQEDCISKYVVVENGTAKARFSLSDLIGIFGGNSTSGFDFSKLFNGTNGTFDMGSLFGENSTFDMSSFFNGTSNFTIGNNTFNISSFLNGTFSIGNNSFNISSLMNGNTTISFGNITIDFSSLLRGNRTTTDFSDILGAAETDDNIKTNNTFDLGSLFSGNSTIKIGNTTFDLSSLLNGTFSIGNGTFDISGLLNGTYNITMGNTTFDFSSLFNTTNGTFDISAFIDLLLGRGNNTFAYLFTPGTYKMTVTYLSSRNFNQLSNDKAKLIITPSNVTFPLTTDITCKDVSTVAVNTAIDGKIGGYLTLTLKDVLGDAVSNKTVQIGFNGAQYNVVTDANGNAKLQINVAKAGVYTASICFLGDNIYNGAFKVVKVTINKQKAKLTAAKKSFKAKAKKKILKATLKTAKGKAIKGKKITFKIKGKTYKAKTNKKGIAKVKVKLSKKGKYKYTVKFAGDNTYKAISKKAKLTIK